MTRRIDVPLFDLDGHTAFRCPGALEPVYADEAWIEEDTGLDVVRRRWWARSGDTAPRLIYEDMRERRDPDGA